MLLQAVFRAVIVIATHGIEGPYGHGLGRIDVYFAYNGQGELEILNIEHIVEY